VNISKLKLRSEKFDNNKYNVMILWNQQCTGHYKLCQRARNMHIILGDSAVSGNRNMIKKEAETILKYEHLTVEGQRA
jgi:hypothetical protein